MINPRLLAALLLPLALALTAAAVLWSVLWESREARGSSDYLEV